MVGRVLESCSLILNYASSPPVLEDIGIGYVLHHYRRTIDKVDSFLTARRSLEFPFVLLLYDIDVWCVFEHIVMDEKTRVVQRISVSIIVQRRQSIEISRHKPPLVLRILRLCYGVLADIGYLLKSVIVSTVRCCAFLLCGRPAYAECILLRPGVHSNKIHHLVIKYDLVMAAAVRNDRIRTVANDLVYGVDRIS